MTYLQVNWSHNFEEEPVELLSELDSQRYEVRKVERFRDGSMTFAGPQVASGSTLLGEVPVPSMEEIAADPEFQPSIIDKDTFERAWQAAMMLTAA